MPKPGGPEPISIANGVPPSEGSLMAPPPRAITVGQRWPSHTVALDAQTPDRWSLKSVPAAQSASGASGSALSYAAEMMQVPLWPIKPRAD